MSLMTAIAFVLERWLLPSSGTVLVILAGVIITSLSVPNRIAYGAVIFGALAFNFLFTAPRGSLHMEDFEEITTMAVFLAVGLAMVYWITRERIQRAELNDAELRSTILLSLSHDLRSPLTSIIGNLSTLQIYREQISVEQQEELINAASEESERLHSYLENLFQATRFEHGAVHIFPQKISVHDVIVETIKRLPANSRINYLASNHPECIIEVQVSLFTQALYNILDNALRYSNLEKPVTIDLKATAHGSTTGAEIMITNYLNEPLVESPTNWLKPFYSARKGDRGHGGAGLGLSVAFSIIKAHQGQLSFESDEHQLKVRIRLP
ncbi:DUF4118 domain-containing protein [Pseudidiomarina andamanensis]|uniref:histidine kinase n=2 Tax=Pseudidiomarina andamanensis TaxID=1940690 RepID=A0AA92IL20_9GAMM|nr:DUF4118 domain-containing protein [Pseudidiomarina andamanensis]QGT95085.1 DUF4118 domain-containing protein [Pseudidiomarina andamanensis]